jgi:RNA polymerase sigma factor (sigma-70 family)
VANSLPFDLLSKLFSADTPSSRDAAWAAFVQAASKLLLHTAHSMGGGYDAAMDRFAFMLDQLQRDDFRRLRAFHPEGCGKLSTWLVVVARRLCLDSERQRFGRSRAEATSEHGVTHIGRRRLAQLAGVALDPDSHPPAREPDALQALCAVETERELHLALAGLTPQERLLLKLRYEDGLSASVIARMLGLPTPFHVYRRTTQLLTGLRQSLRRLPDPERSAGDRPKVGETIPMPRSVPYK